jgi:hypothetical protein
MGGECATGREEGDGKSKPPSVLLGRARPSRQNGRRTDAGPEETGREERYEEGCLRLGCENGEGVQ